MASCASLVAVVLLAGSAVPAVAGKTVDPSEAAALTNTVRQDCGACHGITLKGGLGSPITADALQGYDVQALRDVILHGVPGTAMPPWKGIITADEAEWIAERLIEGTLK